MPFGFTTEQVVIGLVLFALSTVTTSVVVVTFLVLIRADHFIASQHGLRRRIASPVLRVLYVIAKNLAGVVLVVLGIVLSLPGVPGQGLLTILVGVFLLDIPGKRRLELGIVRRPRLLRSINRLRARFDKPPLEVAVLQTNGARDSEPPSEPPSAPPPGASDA